MKRLALAITLITSAALLSGCIIVPPRHGGYYDGHGHRYDGGRGWGEPGPRR